MQIHFRFMLLRFFRINDPYRLLGLILMLSLFSIPYFLYPAPVTLQELRGLVLGEAVHQGKLMYVGVVDSTAPLMAGILGLMDIIMGRSLAGQHILALIILLFQSAFFAILLINNKAYNDNTYVPALVFGLLCFFSFDLISFSPELLGSTVLLLALNNLFKEIEFRIEKDEIILNLGTYLGLASMLIFSYTIFLFATILILITFTRLSVRKLCLLLFGFFLPHVLLFCLYYLWGETSALVHHYYWPNLTVHGDLRVGVQGLLFLGALPVAYFILSLFMLNREAHFTKYQSQLFQIMFQWMLVCLAQLFVSRDLSPHSLIIFIPSFAYFISHYLLLIRRKWIAETMLWILMTGLLAVNLMARKNTFGAVRYESLFPAESPYAKQVHGRKIMVLAEDAAIYRDNEMAGYFLDWNLSREVFEQPDYYDNVLLVARAFRTDPPELVVDPRDLLSKFLERIPELKQNYRRQGDFYEKVTR